MIRAKANVCVLSQYLNQRKIKARGMQSAKQLTWLEAYGAALSVQSNGVGAIGNIALDLLALCNGGLYQKAGPRCSHGKKREQHGE